MAAPETQPRARQEPQAEAPDQEAHSGFHVHLEHFEGPFDLLLQLITRRRLDITELALAEVTDDFLAHLKGQAQWDLDEASEFLLVAATLLDLKAARLLPSGEVEDIADLELLEARDLLFARLLQYRAFKQVAAELAEAWQNAARRYPRSVALEPRFAALLPPLEITIGAERFAQVAARVLGPKPPPPQVSVAHLHSPVVTVAEEAMVVVAQLRRDQQATFADLIATAPTSGHVVARFLSLLELYRSEQITFTQPEALEELLVVWVGSASGDVEVADDYDDVPGQGNATGRPEEAAEAPRAPTEPAEPSDDDE